MKRIRFAEAAHRGGVASAAAIAAAAFQAGAQSTPETTIRVEVTGSHIPRTEGETALPVQVITEEDIKRAGWTTTAELMRHVAANFNGFNDQLSVGESGTPGLASANLRGIGSGSTLVLLNGRRLANYAFMSETVDLNAIPIAALERVEILKDGASSIYGTDAIAGVVNFITRKNYRGIEAVVHADVVERAGGDRQRATLSLGYGDLARDRFNAFATIDWQKAERIRAIDRPFSRTRYLPHENVNELVAFAVFPANVRVGFSEEGAVFVSPAFATGCAPPSSLPQTGRLGNGFCAYDTPSQVDIVPASERWNVLARAAWQVAPGHEAFVEYAFARSKLSIDVAATPVVPLFTNSGVPILYPEDGPYYPTELLAQYGISGDRPINYRTVRLGPRTSAVDTDAHNVVAGMQGEWRGWSYNAAYTHSVTTSEDTMLSGWVSESRFREAMGTGLINPFGPSGPEGDALESSTAIGGSMRSAKGTTDAIDARLAGELARLAAGPLSAAFGAEARRERLSDVAADLLSSGDIMSQPPFDPPRNARRRVWAAFAEVVVPVARSLEAQLSARYDHYSDFGGTANPKIALRWQPVRSTLVRGSWGTGFRAPTLPDLFLAQTEGLAGGEDPLRCPVTGLPSDCIGPYRTVYGGNPGLQPERSRQWGVGAVWEPIEAISLSLDYWNIDKRNVIDSLDSDFVLAHADAFDTSVVRGPIDPRFPDLPGPIDTLLLYNQNLGNLKTSGFDISLRARSPATAFGRFTFSLDGTYIDEWTPEVRGLETVNRAGAYALAEPIPRWRHHASLDWSRGGWGATLAHTFQSSYTDQNPGANGEARRVGAYELWDVQLRYAGFRNTTLALGVKNVFDRAPPFTNQLSTFHVGYDPHYADPRGRTFYARASYAFP